MMPMKVVTKRHGEARPIEDAAILQRTINKLRGPALVPRGVYRFTTQEEANEWMIRQIVNTHARLKLKT